MSELNPQVTVISVGTRKLREVTIYPLSLSDQFKMTDAIVSAFKQFTEATTGSDSDTAMVAAAIKIIEKNLESILKLVLDSSDSIDLDELTNDQFADLVLSIYDTNYDSAIKKFKGLNEKLQAIMPKTEKVKA